MAPPPGPFQGGEGAQNLDIPWTRKRIQAQSEGQRRGRAGHFAGQIRLVALLKPLHLPARGAASDQPDFQQEEHLKLHCLRCTPGVGNGEEGFEALLKKWEKGHGAHNRGSFKSVGVIWSSSRKWKYAER